MPARVVALYLWIAGILFCGSLSFAQSITPGVIGGVRTTDDLNGAGATGVSKRYVVGPTVDVGLPLGFSLEVDALYRREGYQSSFSNFGFSIFSDERANSWEFPILVKHSISLPAVKPFLELGYAPRVIHGSISSTNFYPASLINPGAAGLYHTEENTNWRASHGLVGGGGVQFEIGRLQLSPAVRYTHWSNVAIYGYYGDGPSWQSTQNQFDVLLNVGWRFRLKR